MATGNQISSTLFGQSGTGAYVGNNSPTLTTPNIGAATATSVTFGGTVLNTYNSGTWTPIFAFNTLGNLSVSYAAQDGIYTTIGNVCIVMCTMTFTPTYTTATGIAFVRQLPVPQVAGAINIRGFIAVESPTYNGAQTFLLSNFSQNTSSIQIQNAGSGTALTNLTQANFLTATQYTIHLNAAYQV